MILVIKHIDIEGPGTIETYFRSKGYQLKTVELYNKGKLPENLNDIEAVVCLGGPMNVYEEEKHPFLRAENNFIQMIIKTEIPYLGICLGSQLLAKACGARVVKSPVKEVGWFEVELEKQAKADPLFENFKPKFDVYHWHEDMFQIPDDGMLLATSQGCPHQAFKVGTCAYGVQFHIEVTRDIIADWCKSYFKSNDKVLQNRAKKMLKVYDKKKKTFHQDAEIVYNNFEKIIQSRKRALQAASQ